MKYEFDYVKIGNKFFPIIPFIVKNKEEFVPLNALVDSGATISLFNADVGRALKIDIEKGEKFYPTGIGGKILTYIHEVNLKIGDHEIKTKVAFTDELAVRINLLGRENVFENFSVLFNDKLKKIVLEKI
jgi:predicted aspartyl protease